jgi:hypothetical protein
MKSDLVYLQYQFTDKVVAINISDAKDANASAPAQTQDVKADAGQELTSQQRKPSDGPSAGYLRPSRILRSPDQHLSSLSGSFPSLPDNPSDSVLNWIAGNPVNPKDGLPIEAPDVQQSSNSKPGSSSGSWEAVDNKTKTGVFIPFDTDKNETTQLNQFSSQVDHVHGLNPNKSLSSLDQQSSWIDLSSNSTQQPDDQYIPPTDQEADERAKQPYSLALSQGDGSKTPSPVTIDPWAVGPLPFIDSYGPTSKPSADHSSHSKAKVSKKKAKKNRKSRSLRKKKRKGKRSPRIPKKHGVAHSPKKRPGMRKHKRPRVHRRPKKSARGRGHGIKRNIRKRPTKMPKHHLPHNRKKKSYHITIQ